MASNLDFLVAFLLGILPGIWILWTSLHRFDRPYVDRTLFDDRRVFGSLAVGLVFGTVASVFALSIPRVDIVGILVAVSASFLFEESFKLVWLNRRAYQGRFATDFYAALSVATAAGFGLIIYYYVYNRILPGTLPEEIRRELRRERRRAPSPRG